jgi:LPXTG-motif cell wall-anchored protein
MTGMVLAGFGLAAAPAHADAKVYLKVWPAKGTLSDTINLYLPTGAFCPAEANRVIVRMTGPLIDQSPGTETEWGFNLTGNTDITALDTLSIPGTSIFPLLWTWRDAGGNMTPNPVDFDGKYRITLWCLKGLDFRNSLGDTIADVVINHSANAFEVTTPQPKGPEDEVLTGDPAVVTDDPTLPASADPSSAGQTDSSSAPPSTDPSGAAGPTDGAQPNDGSGGAVPSGQVSDPSAGVGVDGASGDGAGGGTVAQQPVSAATPDSGSSGRTWIVIGGLVLIAGGVAYGFWGRKKSPAA